MAGPTLPFIRSLPDYMLHATIVNWYPLYPWRWPQARVLDCLLILRMPAKSISFPSRCLPPVAIVTCIVMDGAVSFMDQVCVVLKLTLHPSCEGLYDNYVRIRWLLLVHKPLWYIMNSIAECRCFAKNEDLLVGKCIIMTSQRTAMTSQALW